MATIALRNSPSWNCSLRLKRHPKREKLRQHLGKSHAPGERRRRKRARRRDSKVEGGYISIHLQCLETGKVRPCTCGPAHVQTAAWHDPVFRHLPDLLASAPLRAKRNTC